MLGDLVDATVAAGGAFGNLGSAATMSPAFTWCSGNMSTCFAKGGELVKNILCRKADLFFGNAFVSALNSSSCTQPKPFHDLLFLNFLLGWRAGLLRQEASV